MVVLGGWTFSYERSTHVGGHQLFPHIGSALFQASDHLVEPELVATALQGYLAHKEPPPPHKESPPPGTLPQAHAPGPTLVWGGGGVFS